jgi:hypothetical protein
MIFSSFKPSCIKRGNIVGKKVTDQKGVSRDSLPVYILLRASLSFLTTSHTLL